MSKLQLLRRALLIISPVLTILVTVAIWPVSVPIALLAMLALLSLSGALAVLDRCVRSEMQQRWQLRRQLEARITELHTVVDGGSGHPEIGPMSTSELASYHQQAMVLHRLKEVERALGINRHRSTASQSMEDHI